MKRSLSHNDIRSYLHISAFVFSILFFSFALFSLPYLLGTTPKVEAESCEARVSAGGVTAYDGQSKTVYVSRSVSVYLYGNASGYNSRARRKDVAGWSSWTSNLPLSVSTIQVSTGSETYSVQSEGGEWWRRDKCSASLQVKFQPPSANISANPSSLTEPERTDIDYVCYNSRRAYINGHYIDYRSTTGTLRGTKTYQPHSDQTYTLRCTNTDGDADTDSVTVDVTTPPRCSISINAYPRTVSPGESTRLLWDSTYDADGILITSGQWQGKKKDNGGEFVTPPSSPGTYTYGLSGSDILSRGCSDSVSVTVSSPPPTATLSAIDSSVHKGEGARLSYSCENSDVYRVNDNPKTSASGTHTQSWNTSGTQSNSLVCRDSVSDLSASDGAPVEVVNRNPNARYEWSSADGGDTIYINVISNDSDPDGDSVRLSSVDSVRYGSASEDGGRIRYTAPSNLDGIDVIRYTIVDDDGNNPKTDSTYSYVRVEENQAPNADFTYTTNGLTANFTDTSTDSDGSISSRSWSFGDSTTSSATNPSRTYSSGGTYSVRLTVKDNDGATDYVTKRVTVKEETSPPVAVTDSVRMRCGDTKYINVVANDYDPDGGDVDLISVGSARHGSASRYNDTYARYRAPDEYSGSDSFSYTIEDDEGATDTGSVSVSITCSATSVDIDANPKTIDYGGSTTVLWTVSGDANWCSASGTTGDWSGYKSTSGGSESVGPIWQTGSVRATLTCDGPGGRAADTVWITVREPSDAPSVSLSVSPSSVDYGESSTLSWTASGEVDSCTATGDWSGSKSTSDSESTGPQYDDSSYTLSCTGPGGSHSDTENVSVGEEPNSPPTADNDSYTVFENSSNNSFNVLSNDSDLDGDSLAVSRIMSQPSHGSVSISGNDILYIPNNGYVGSDSFSYRATDGPLESNTAQVSITVQAAEDYSIQLSPSSVELSENTHGTSDAVTVTIVRINGFDGRVNLSIDSGGTSPELSGAEYSFSDPALTGSETQSTLLSAAGYNFSDSALTGSETQSTFVVTVDDPLDPGTYTVRVRAHTSEEPGTRYRSFDINVDSPIDPEYEEF